MHYRRRHMAERQDELHTDKRVCARYKGNYRKDVPQGRGGGRLCNAVPGCMHGSCGNYRNWKYSWRCGRHSHRRSGRCFLDVVQRAARHVYEVFRSNAGSAFQGKEFRRRLGRRSYVLYKERAWKKLALPCLYICSAGRAYSFRYRKRYTGQHDHSCYRLSPYKLRSC